MEAVWAIPFHRQLILLILLFENSQNRHLHQIMSPFKLELHAGHAATANVFTTRCYASAVLAMALCLSIRPSGTAKARDFKICILVGRVKYQLCDA